MVDQPPPPLTTAEAKSRLLALDEPGDGSPGGTRSFVLPAAGAAFILGILLSRPRRGSLLGNIAALAANPALRSAAFSLAGAALRPFLSPPAR